MLIKIFNSSLMKPTCSLLAFLVLLMSNVNSACANEKVTLKAGTPVMLMPQVPLTSATLKAGQTVPFTVTQDVVVDGKKVISSGSVAQGQVISAKKRSVFGIPGKFEIQIKSVYAVDNTFIFLTNGDVNSQGKSKIALSVVLTVIVCWLCLLIRGGEAEGGSNIICAMTATNAEIMVQ